jgi:hypothetical protein
MYSRLRRSFFVSAGESCSEVDSVSPPLEDGGEMASSRNY